MNTWRILVRHRSGLVALGFQRLGLGTAIAEVQIGLIAQSFVLCVLLRDYNRALRIFRMLRATTYTALLCFVFLAPLDAQQGRGGVEAAGGRTPLIEERVASMQKLDGYSRSTGMSAAAVSTSR